MKHQTQKQIKEFHKKIAVANIQGLIRKGNIKGAIECAEIAGITPEEFGKIVKETK